MYSKRWVHILMVALAILVATRASFFHHDIEVRQNSISAAEDSSTAADSSTPTPTPSDTDTPTPTTSDEETSSTPPPTTSTKSTSTSSEPKPTTSDTPTTAPTTAPSTTAPTTAPTTSSGRNPITTPTPTATPTSSSGGNGGNTGGNTGGNGGGETSNPGSEPQPTATPTKKTTFTTAILYTLTDDSGNAHVSSSEAVVVSTPGLVGGGGSKNQNGGLSDKDKSTIIGVTVGVGGAIVLAAAGILFWRLRNKRRNQDESEELISYGPGFGGPGTAEKSEASGPSANTRSPFQSTLETYHAPSHANAASNF